MTKHNLAEALAVNGRAGVWALVLWLLKKIFRNPEGFGLRQSSAAFVSLLAFERPVLLICLAALLFSCSCSLAQRQPEPRPAPLEPAQAEREARTLIAEMLSQKPAQTNTGLLKIRNSKGEQREIPMRFEIWPTATGSISTYEAKDSGRKVQLAVTHSHGQPNQYAVKESESPPKTLAGNDTMVPFVGSDFYIADLGLEFLHWPQQRILRKEM